MTDTASPALGWCVVELLGHRRVLGHVTEATLAGASFLQVETVDDPPIVQFYAPASVYCITPTTEDVVRRHTAPRPPLAIRHVPDDDLDDDELDEDLDITPEWTI
jgi:hypothetical protein